MLPVSVIKGKVRSCFSRSGFSHCRYEEAEVVNYGHPVRVQCTSASSLVVAQHSENFGGKMVARVACHFSDNV